MTLWVVMVGICAVSIFVVSSFFSSRHEERAGNRVNADANIIISVRIGVNIFGQANTGVYYLILRCQNQSSLKLRPRVIEK